MNKRVLNFRIVADVIVVFAGVAIFFGAWVFGVELDAILIKLFGDLGVAPNSPHFNGVFLSTFHRFDSFREYFYVIGLFLVILGSVLFRTDVLARKDV